MLHLLTTDILFAAYERVQCVLYMGLRVSRSNVQNLLSYVLVANAAFKRS